MPFSTPTTRFLDKQGVPYRLFTHSHGVSSLEEAANERGEEIGQIIRSILFRVHQDAYIMVLMAGGSHISWKKVRVYLGVARLSMASENEVKNITGFDLGTVNPFGCPTLFRILADNSVFNYREISLGCGLYGSAIIINSTDLLSALKNLEIGDFLDS